MATIQKRKCVNGKERYTVTIRLKGVNSQTATFDRLTDAKRWSASTESSIREGRYLHAAYSSSSQYFLVSPVSNSH